MDAIGAFDEGVYAHFDFQDQYNSRFWHAAYYMSSDIGVGALVVAAVALFVMRNKQRSALVAFVSLAASFVLIDAIRLAVPRPRPGNASKWLGAQDLVGSYPSKGVFLFMLAAILLGFALWDLARPWQRGLYVLIAAALTVWVCMSQFFLAIHFLTDIIGGLIGATLVGWIAYRFLDRTEGKELPEELR